MIINEHFRKKVQGFRAAKVRIAVTNESGKGFFGRAKKI
jgi:hypothetical protein